MLYTHQTVILPDGRKKEWEGPLDETDYDQNRYIWLKKHKMTDENARTTISMLNHEKRYVLTYVLFFTTSWTMIVRGRFFGHPGFEMTYTDLSYADTLDYVKKYVEYLY